MIACLDNGTGASLQSSDNVQDDSIFLIRDISVLVRTELEKEMATHSSPGGSVVKNLPVNA